MAARVALPYPTADITRQIQDLVLECADLPGFLADLSETTYREGPEWAATLDATMVGIADLRSEDRWPGFVETARRGRVLSVLALPLQLEGSTNAGMSFYSPRPHGFGRDGIAAAHALSAESAKGLRLVLRIASLQESAENLRTAMGARPPASAANPLNIRFDD
jgi:hypothetical protein